jgi:hypothetical protein
MHAPSLPIPKTDNFLRDMRRSIRKGLFKRKIFKKGRAEAVEVE